MTSQTLVPRAHFVANGVQAAFGFSFPVYESGDMEVWIDQNLQPAEAYAVSGVGVAVGGTVIFTVPPPASSQVTLRRRMAINRTPEFPDTSVQAKPLNQEFGYHVAALQQIADEAGLAVKRSFRSLSTADLTLPEPSAGRALRWNDSGDGLANSAAEVDTILPLATAKAQEASASAAAAAASQISAAASAAGAATSRDICDADVVVTGSDRAAVAADRADVAADRAAVQADRLAADASAAAAALSQGAAQASESAALQAATGAAASEANSATDAATAQAAASAAAASQASAHASELSASGSASAAAASAAQAQSAAGVYTFASVAVAGQGTLFADQPGDTLTLAAGTALTITTDAASDTVTMAIDQNGLESLIGLSLAGRALIGDADSQAQRVTLGLGTAATLDRDTDTALAADSDTRLATQKAVKAYIAAQIAAIQGVPSGIVAPFAGPAAPIGWLACDGAAVSRTAYAALFAAIGISHGGGDGSTTFNLPDMQGRTAIGKGQGSGLTNRTLGSTLGEESHTLTVAEMPAHSHGSGSSNYGTFSTGADYVVNHFSSAVVGGNTGSAGGGSPHNNMQPSTVLTYIIKT